MWLWYNLESPLHSHTGAAGGLVEWTATYRRESTIVAPYAKVGCRRPRMY